MTDQELFPAGQDDQTHCELDNPGDYCMKSGTYVNQELSHNPQVVAR